MMSILNSLRQKLGKEPAVAKLGGQSRTSTANTRAVLAKAPSGDSDFFVFGLHYGAPLLLNTRQKELQQFTALHKASHSCFITIKDSSNRNVSLMAAGSFPAEKGNNYFAAAAAICQQNKGADRTYVIELGEDRFVVFQGVASGLLQLGTEIIGNASTVTNLLQDWKNNRSLNAISYLLSAESPILAFVDKGLGATARSTDLLNFKASTNTLLAKQSIPYAKFALVALSVAGVALFAGLKGSQYLERLNVQKNEANEAQQRRANYLNQVNQAVSSAWTGSHQDVYQFVVLPLMQNIELKRVGFKVTEVECDITQRSCSSKWKRVTGTYYEMLSTTTPNQVAVSEDYEVIRLLETADFDKAKKTPPAFTTFPKRKSFLLDIGDVFTEFKLAKMATAGPIDKGTALVSWTGKESPPPVPLNGKLVLAGDIGLINAMLVMPPNTTPNKLVLTAGKGSSFNFRLESNYYVSPDN